VIGRRLYQRDTIDIAFIVKREFSEKARKRSSGYTFDANDTIDTISAKILAR
jgi:hypothetical protein